MTELQHLQKIILSIAKDFDKICKENGIKYYLMGGSCIGAIRHKGFIPWDDDFDVIMDHANYDRLLKVCKEKLDKQKYVLQEGLKDWPLNYTKIRLKGTYFHEPEDDYAGKDNHGIFIDVFCMENVPDNNLSAHIQYLLAKYYLCYQLGKRKYKSASSLKKILIMLSFPLKSKAIRNLVTQYIQKFNSRNTKRLGSYYSITRFKSAITDKKIYGTPKYVPFEDTMLPVPEYYHEYLTQMFGDYMQMPPIEQRKGHHLISVDFGKY